MELVVERTQALVVERTQALGVERTWGELIALHGWGWKVHENAHEWVALPDHPPAGSGRVRVHWNVVIDVSSQLLQVQACPVGEFSQRCQAPQE